MAKLFEQGGSQGLNNNIPHQYHVSVCAVCATSSLSVLSVLSVLLKVTRSHLSMLYIYIYTTQIYIHNTNTNIYTKLTTGTLVYDSHMALAGIASMAMPNRMYIS